MEHAYSAGLTAPAETVTTDNAEMSTLVRRDLNIAIGDDLWDQWDARTKNLHNAMETRRSGAPANRWQTAKSETAEATTESGVVYYDIAQTFADGPIEDCREMARADVRAWLNEWEQSEFTHEQIVFDINSDQERRLSVTNGKARITGDQFAAAWYAKDGSRVDFPNRATWDAFYNAFHAHIEQGNAAFENAMTQIAQAATAASLDAILTGLPTVPGASTARATGPIPGAAPNMDATKPVVSVRAEPV